MQFKWIFVACALLLGSNSFASNCNDSILKITNNSDRDFIFGDVDDGATTINCLDMNTCFMESKGKLNNIQTDQKIPAGGSVMAFARSRLGSRGNAWGKLELHSKNQIILIDYKFNSFLYGLGECKPEIDTKVIGFPGIKVDSNIVASNPVQVYLIIENE